MKIVVEIREVENGWIVENGYFGDESYYETYAEAVNKAMKTFNKFQEEQEIKK